MRTESVVDPTTSANITVTWRRSAVSWVFGSITTTGIEEGASGAAVRAAIAFSSFLRWPEHGQFHDLPGVEMAIDLGEDSVRHRDVTGHGIGIGEHGALARAEAFGRAPVRKRIAFLERKPIGERQGRHVLAQHILRVGEMAHADDHDLAQTPGKRRLPAHRVGVIEPALGERGSVEQHAIDIDQLPAPAGAEFFDHIRKFGVVLLSDQGNASHQYLPSNFWP
jgi:hypothetical protein